MKKHILPLALFLSFSSLVHAQWTTSGTNTTTPATNLVGIGITAPDEKLVVNGNVKTILDPNPSFVAQNVVRIMTLGVSGITGAQNWAIRGVYQYPGGVLLNAAGGDLDIIKSLNGNTILGTKSDGTILGNIGIGTLTPRETLSVNGNIRAKQVKVESANWPDYVFQKDYQLPSLQEVKAYLNQNNHLPEIPSEQQIAKEGLNLGEMNKLLMKKVEELTLYLIEKDKEVKELQETVKKQDQRMLALENK